MKAIQTQAASNPVAALLQQLNQMFSGANSLSMPPQMDARNALRIMGTADQAEQILHSALSSSFANASDAAPLSEDELEMRDLISGILAGLQGRYEDPLGYPRRGGGKSGGKSPGGPTAPAGEPGAKGSSDPAAGQAEGTQGTEKTPEQQTQGGSEAQRPERAEQAKQLKESGALGGKKEEHPEISADERNKINDAIAKANDDGANSLSSNKNAMAVATPEQKAKLIRELMSGHTSDSEDRAIARILQSCTSKAEFDKVMELSGGRGEVMDELDADDAKNAISAAEGKLGKEQQEAAGKAVNLLEQSSSPEEAKELAAQLGGPDLKHQIHDPELLARLDGVAKRYKMPALGYGLPPETVKPLPSPARVLEKRRPSFSIVQLW
jgi:hypothetical protein